MVTLRLSCQSVVKRALSSELAHVERTSVATNYRHEHPEVIKQAAETVRKDPQLRTLTQREVRHHARKHP